MKAIFFSTSLFFLSLSSFSQSIKWTVNAGENPNVALPFDYRYLNPQHRNGYLMFIADRKSKEMLLNYDLLNRWLSSVNEKGDTVPVKKDEGVKYVVMGEETFYHDLQKGYFKILAMDALHKLTSHEEVKVAGRSVKIDEGYGGTTNGTSSTVAVARQSDEIYEKVVQFFLIDEKGEITNANKSGFLKMFPTEEDSIKKWIKKEDIHFKREESILKLFNYCLSLTSRN